MAASWPRPLTAVAAITLALAAPADGEPIRTGFDAVSLPHADDISGPVTNIGFDVNFLGQSFSSLYVNSNGNLTFGSPLSAFSPVPLNQLGAMVVAPFFADVDTSIAGQVTYGSGIVDGRSAFGATWAGVPYHGLDPRGLNSFQAILVDRADTGAGNFDLEYNYGKIAWESGDFSGGVEGLGGSSARVGFSGGTADNSLELPGSGSPGSLLNDGGNALTKGLFASETPGRYLYSSRGGAFTLMGNVPPPPTEEPTEPTPIPPPATGEVTPPVPTEPLPTMPPSGPTSVPEPASIVLASLGAGLIGVRRMRG